MTKVKLETLAILLLAIAVFWHAQNGKYQAVIASYSQFDKNTGNRTFHKLLSVNTRTGGIEAYCDVGSGVCSAWQAFSPHEHATQQLKSESTDKLY